jgi:hypothetical protein
LIEYKGFLYGAASWKTARRVVAKVEHHAGELFPPVGFVVTNLSLLSRAVVRFYNKRGTSEQWIKEGKPQASAMCIFSLATAFSVQHELRSTRPYPCRYPETQGSEHRAAGRRGRNPG